MNPMDQLLGPIALYPDPLIALILPASTSPMDITAAANFLGAGGDPSATGGQPWDPSVKALVHYPAVVEWMAQNLDWTQALGAAFQANPADVMGSIQHLRGIARAAGTLTDNSQQIVVMEGDNIAIEPAQSEVIYVPSYDPAVVYVDGPYYGYNGPFITYGPGFPVGIWLSFNFDWQRRSMFVGDWRNWHHRDGWAHPTFPGQRGYINAPGSHRWNPPAGRPEQNRESPQSRPEFRPQGRPEARPQGVRPETRPEAGPQARPGARGNSIPVQPRSQGFSRPQPMRGAPLPPHPNFQPRVRTNAAPVHRVEPARQQAPSRKDDKPHN